MALTDQLKLLYNKLEKQLQDYKQTEEQFTQVTECITSPAVRKWYISIQYDETIGVTKDVRYCVRGTLRQVDEYLEKVLKKWGTSKIVHFSYSNSDEADMIDCTHY